MKRLLSAAIVAMAASGPAWAQATGSLGPNIMNEPGPGGSGGSSTATGTGVGKSTSRSQAISGQSGSAAITSNSTAPADQTVKNVPSAADRVSDVSLILSHKRCPSPS